MRYVVVDLEATCWEERGSPTAWRSSRSVPSCCRRAAGRRQASSRSFVRPVESPLLSDFCTRLTSIRQQDVDGAPTFPEVLPRFVAWIGGEPFISPRGAPTTSSSSVATAGVTG